MIVITALEQELGTELDLVPTLLHLVMEGKRLFQVNLFSVLICHEKQVGLSSIDLTNYENGRFLQDRPIHVRID